jgi:hypothetical protein
VGQDGILRADCQSARTRGAAIATVRALALRVAADCIDHGEEVPAPLARSFIAF